MRVFAALFFLIILFASAPSVASGQTYTVVVNNAPPYRIIENNSFYGFYIDIIKEIAQETNIKLNFVEVPFKRGLKMMERGYADLMLGPNKKPEREKFMEYFNEDLPREKKVIFMAKGSPNIKKPNELSGKSIAFLRGASYANYFENVPDIRTRYFSKHHQGFLQLEANRLDYLVQPEFLADYLLKELNMDFEKTDYFIIGKPSYFAISKKNFPSKVENSNGK